MICQCQALKRLFRDRPLPCAALSALTAMARKFVADTLLQQSRQYGFRSVLRSLQRLGSLRRPQSPRIAVHSKAALQGQPEDTIPKIASELELAQGTSAVASLTPPRNWQGTGLFRLFISHISKDKLKATRLKECLSPSGIAGFVAHEDIKPTLEWQDEIERGLNTMDATVAIHTPGFSQSTWTQQEVGFALGRGVKIISFEMGEQSTGFISRRQSMACFWRKAARPKSFVPQRHPDQMQTTISHFDLASDRRGPEGRRGEGPTRVVRASQIMIRNRREPPRRLPPPA